MQPTYDALHQYGDVRVGFLIGEGEVDFVA